MFHVTSGERTTKHFFQTDKRVDRISQKITSVSQKRKHCFGENSENRKIMSEKTHFAFYF